MQIDVQITMADYVAFSRYVQKVTRPRGRSLFIVLAAVLAAVLFVAAVFLLEWAGFLRFDVGTAYSILIGTLAIIPGWIILSGRQCPFRDDGYILGRQTYRLEPDGMRHFFRYGETFVRWEGICAIHETPQHVFVMVEPMLGNIVPKSAFTDERQLAAFMDLLHTHAERTARSD